MAPEMNLDETPQQGAPKRSRKLPPLRLLYNRDQSIEMMERLLKRERQAPLRILEAGCGTTWPLQLEGVPYVLTGVDVDTHALDARRRCARPTDTLLHGDLRRRELFGPGQFDAIYNSFVLEHVDGAERVLNNFMYWLAPGGVLILRIPDRDAVYGFLTRITPFWFHVLYKKYVCKMPNAGKPGYDPFPTFYDDVVSRRGIHRYCREHGCTVRDEAGGANYIPKHTVFAPVLRLIVRTVGLLSLGKLDWRHNNLTFVIEK
jgi:SAM-dependent methyltransferase